MPAPLSIIIPAYNAEGVLPLCLASLMPGLETGLIREVILVDGGSEDQTRRLAEGAGANVITAPEKGRAAQLLQGAREARGDWLLFLHADTALSRDWGERAKSHIAERKGKAAAFTLAYRSDHPMAKIVARRANWRARTLGLPYGDQGLLISRKLYDEVGGYPNAPFMEDLKIVRAIGKTRLTILSAEARTDASKYDRDGWRKRSWRNAILVTRYFLGASPEKLAKSYS
ncbi:MAG: TIGR04283 family arsenosugar biosynthesis glycosyltransferase [Henriciella sp.]|nr:TIGR04283 family arsenosugar biosynthesis glycosyltransferase [Henriciella sp.]MBO6694737.1 TIGR04283 family arsenosugar biosynthesis glycosyltransferase [Henriciella sp.]